MNYFELFEIPASFQPNPDELRKKFYALSRKYHPDFFSNAAADEQAEVLQKSSEVNKGFKVLSNPDETMRYLLQLKGLLEEEEKYQLPAEFLMEMMELNELALEGNAEKARLAVEAIQQDIYEPVKSIIAEYQDGITPAESLLKVKDYYFKKKYLNRVMQGLD
ncbi:MAG TPA: Fe-S protein assembly co-chaperone HscB [Chitinophagaceae bacterium]